ncbi:MAG: hypothetical protein ACK5XX_00570 [Holosporales bacterium]|jgi:hypothetical protein|nr:hypothetical protein [Thalassospira sp.]
MLSRMEVQLIDNIKNLAALYGVKPATICRKLGWDDGKAWKRLSAGGGITSRKLRESQIKIYELFEAKHKELRQRKKKQNP